VRSASTVRHSRRLAWFPAPCSCSATSRLVHIQEDKVDFYIFVRVPPLHIPDAVTVVSAMTAAQITDIVAGKKEASHL
jgi:chorismate synthase